jgi:hypothetical protein
VRGVRRLVGGLYLYQVSDTLPRYPDTAARIFNYMWRYSYNLAGLYETPSLTEEPARREEAEALIREAREAGRLLLTEHLLSCSCGSGIDQNGNSIPQSNTYCGFEACGSDFEIQTCTSGGWSRTGRYCYTQERCTCYDGIYADGTPIPPSATSCGFKACGLDYEYEECTSEGWKRLGSFCY